uniref:Tektin n=2 Tax=Schistocephalus solidus TaxID=70667 RepID=A0A0X3Q366_SCHSO
MEFMGHSQTSCYLTASRRQQITNKLPVLASLPPLKPTLPDTCPTPYPHRRSLTTLAYRPANYYSAAKISPAYPLTHSQVDSRAADTQLSEICGLRVPSVYSVARNALYTRYTPKNWSDSNQRLLQANDRAQKDSECLAHDSIRLEKELDDRTKMNQDDSTRRLGDKICDITFWASELDDEIGKMLQENNDLLRARRIAEKLLAESENQLHVSQECLYNREKRQGLDLVHDEVEKQLIEEVNLTRSLQDCLRKLIDDAKTQEQLNRAALHELEMDKANKFMNLQLDEAAHSLKNSSAGVHYYDGVECIDQTQSVPETWNAEVADKIRRSQAERTASRKMRERIAKGVAHASKALADKWNAVNAALAQRIREVTDARNQLQASLGKTLQAIADTEKEIEDLKKSVIDKENHLKTATTRLNTRLRRPGMENCRDPAMLHLICEVQQLKDAIQTLKDQIRRAEGMLQELLRLRTEKEGQVAVKNNSLFIDREKCLALRSTWPGGPTAGAANAIPCPSNTVSTVRACNCA